MDRLTREHIELNRPLSLRAGELGAAFGTILLHSGYAINFVQTDVEPSKTPLENSRYAVRILKPDDKGELRAAILHGDEVQEFLSTFPVFKSDYIMRGATIDHIAAIASSLATLPAPSNFTTNDIPIRNTIPNGVPYSPTQLWKTRIDPMSGAMQGNVNPSTIPPPAQG